MKMKHREYLNKLVQLFVVFLKLGPSTFGGGYAMITAIEREVVEKKSWLKQDEVGDMVSVAGSAPGGVAVNSAAYIGYRLAGTAGAVIAVTGITLPTLLIVLILSVFGTMYKDVPKVAAALKGVHAAVVALIILAAYRVGRSSIFDSATLVITGLTVLVLFFTSLNSVYLILGGPAAGVAVIIIKHALGISAVTEKDVKDNQLEINYPEYYI
ncbi:chromate transporter [Paenibacillus sp. MMS20-IR301]|uniref:chromate transporter n=1 Tax=Paenibacillus sp. MMS20-IR301 TaxID=2895946 RepID=UPI0028E93CFB|nr:chromate transporter [Paenibacillus sp. MMS20-IR301]WNS44007.1 chromate transporter [Paenibacillus sp. MMS20-IR301]